MRSVKVAALIITGFLAAGALASCGNKSAKDSAEISYVDFGEGWNMNDSAQHAVENFARSNYDTPNGEVFYCTTLSDDKLEEMKSDSEEWKKTTDSFAKQRQLEFDGGNYSKVETADFSLNAELSKKALKNAEAEFISSSGAKSPKATEGCSYTFIITSHKKNGDELKSGLEVSAVKFEGEGWKVLNASADALENISK